MQIGENVYFILSKRPITRIFFLEDGNSSLYILYYKNLNIPLQHLQRIDITVDFTVYLLEVK